MWLSKLDSWPSLDFCYPNMDSLCRSPFGLCMRQRILPPRERPPSRALLSCSRTNATTPHASSASSSTALAPVLQSPTNHRRCARYPCVPWWLGWLCPFRVACWTWALMMPGQPATSGQAPAAAELEFQAASRSIVYVTFRKESGRDRDGSQDKNNLVTWQV
jgi:hypothetical protein